MRETYRMLGGLGLLSAIIITLMFAAHTDNVFTTPAYSAEPQAAAGLAPESGTTSATLTVGCYQTLELVFSASTTPANPFDTYLLKLEITDPTGRTRVIDGFYDGDGAGGQTGTMWKARITPDAPGTWRWRTVPGDVRDEALLGLSGSFECVESGASGGLVRDGRHFRLQRGPFIYLVGNFLDRAHGLRTTHTFMGETTTDEQRDAIIARQRDFHTANKMNLYIANKGDYDGQSVTPWLGTADENDRTRMDLHRWNRFDEHLIRLKETRLLAELWFFADDSDFGSLSEAERRRLIRYTMARTSAFSHTFYVLALEWQEAFSAQEVTTMGTYMQDHNPWGRPLSVHSLNQSEWAFADESWATFIASQAGNSATPDQVNAYALAMRAASPLPHIDEEFGKLTADSDTRLRANLWANFAGGAAGGGTGSDLKALQRFIAQSRVPFQRMAPANRLVESGGRSRFALAETAHHYVVYSTKGAFGLTVEGTDLVGRWFNPRDPNATLGSPFEVSPGPQRFTPPRDTDKDWVLWISDGSNLNAGVTHPSAGMTVTRQHVTPQAEVEPTAVPPETKTPTVAASTTETKASEGPTEGKRIRINFQPASSETPAGYYADDGTRFRPRDDGYEYGWRSDTSAYMRERSDPRAQDERTDTLNHLQRDGQHVWEIALPNGRYRVILGMGDPTYTNQRNDVQIEDVTLSDPDGYDHFDTYTDVEVVVRDGRLTLQPAPTAENAKVNYIEITSLRSPSPSRERIRAIIRLASLWYEVLRIVSHRIGDMIDMLAGAPD